ncbi:MAP3K12-binding inhibitory protein 1-like [Anneissia japonica]|uniref:MAP3K12-binding inhibitory protein 1-like n=1 Tax=Anneissia japonica TaxID=1529436 RepID=UPI00142568CC|nr:MAP3K12-binding inhibitory protein 1-like [Anneissia japonica]
MAEKVVDIIQAFLKFFAEAKLNHCVSLTVDYNQLSLVTSSIEDLCDYMTDLSQDIQKLVETFKSEIGSVADEETAPPQQSSGSTLQPVDKKPVYVTDPSFVQIIASKDEIDRRIKAFIERKQVDVDDNNKREFCSVISPEHEIKSSCARTDAVFKPVNGCKSHVKVSRVVNPNGPQTRPFISTQSTTSQSASRSSTSQSSHELPSSLEERLKNIETHIKLKHGQVPKNIYSRLKVMEQRILQLEGTSPEYFSACSPVKKPKFEAENREGFGVTISDIDDRIQELKESLKMKQEFGKRIGGS